MSVAFSQPAPPPRRRTNDEIAADEAAAAASVESAATALLLQGRTRRLWDRAFGLGLVLVFDRSVTPLSTLFSRHS